MTIGVAVIGAGMAGRAHAAAYRIAPSLYDSVLPPLRFVSIGDVSPELGSLAARRFGFERSDTSWQAIAADPDIHVVSVVVANFLHREMVEGLLAAGKHVLCEKPLSDTPRRRASHGRRRAERRPGSTDRLHVPPSTRRGRSARPGDLRRPRSRPPRPRPVLLRLRQRSAGSDLLAVQGRARIGRPRRHRQPRRVPGRVPRRRHPAR